MGLALVVLEGLEISRAQSDGERTVRILLGGGCRADSGKSVVLHDDGPYRSRDLENELATLKRSHDEFLKLFSCIAVQQSYHSS